MITVLTSFGQRGYAEYGVRFLQTFQNHWPKEVQLLIYHEGQPKLGGYDLLVDVPSCQAFLARHQFNLMVQGKERSPGHRWKLDCVKKGYNFRYDAYKFCRKIFAIEHAASVVGSGKLFWVDADVVTFENIPLSFLEKMLPDNVCTSYLGRSGGYHSECGFVGYSLDHPRCHAFIKTFAALYRDDTFLNLEEWHDSWVYDWIRRQTGVPGYDISASVSGHVFINSPLGQYMDHLKGDRKIFGRSYPLNDPKAPHTHYYWKRPL